MSKPDKAMPWLRLYTEIIDDEKLGLLAFEDRWHYVAILCLKGKGILDGGDDAELLQRKVALKLGLTLAELEKVAMRLAKMGLIDQSSYQPLAWDDRQMQSDRDPTNAERQRRFRESKKNEKTERNGSNASVTVLDTDTDTDTEKEIPHTAGAGARDAVAGVCGFEFQDSPTAQQPPSSTQPDPGPFDTADPADVAVCLALRRVGIGDANPGNPKLLALLAKGVTLPAFETAAHAALLKTRNDLAYVLGIVRRMVQEAAAIGSEAGIPASAWDADRRSIEAEGVRLGLGLWNADDISPNREHFAAYTERVRSARNATERRAV